MVDEYFAPNEGDNVKMLGFSEGIGPNNTYKASKLRIVESTMEDFEKCSDLYRETRQRILTKSQQFCVALRNHTKHNTNKGDSGGPVLTGDEPPKLLGITSHGFPGLPEVKVLVSGYHDFISNPRGLLRDSNNGKGGSFTAMKRQQQ
ncbi:uncharacterized protein LOC116347271 [Contarinia nasturtii]|uniref:uncharacterized protein LOC116347271 n=1 Tax=Contarinia nasturtii TaxID=265458 RepID=UPI0012D4062D|nr:uncharacterized protein LOC116347271 [Contarinia nasturtii]XP_031633676.1 uncharacterized protein LOC116347271 [Contarinia nasturtii]